MIQFSLYRLHNNTVMLWINEESQTVTYLIRKK